MGGKQAIVLSILFLVLTSFVVVAQDDNAEGITPEKPTLWKLDRFFDKLSLLFTADPEKKAKKNLEIAHERTVEAKVMQEKQLDDEVEQAETEQKKAMVNLRKSVEDLNAPENFLNLDFADLLIKVRLFEKERIAEVEVRQREDLTDFTLNTVNKDEIVLELIQRFKLHERDIRDNMHVKTISPHALRDKTIREINHAEQELESVKAKIADQFRMKRSVLQAQDLMNQAVESLDNARKAFKERDYRTAYQLAMESEELTTQARKQKNFR